MRLRWKWEFSLLPETLYLLEGQMLLLLLLFPPWRGVPNGDYARNQTSQLCHAISTPDRGCVGHPTMVRMVIMVPERGFVWNTKRNYLNQRKGLHFLCSAYITHRVPTMAHLGNSTVALSIFIIDKRQLCFQTIKEVYIPTVETFLFFIYEMCPCLPQKFHELFIYLSLTNKCCTSGPSRCL
jgi:hypothetical protein